MADLGTNVRYIKGIGEARAAALEKLGITTLGDLIAYFPRGYEDRTQVRPIRELTAGESVCVRGMVAADLTAYRISGGRTIAKTRVVDDSGSLDLVFFNMEHRRDALHQGDVCVFFGKVEDNLRRKQMINPLFEPEGRQQVTGRIMPIYPLTAGVTQGLMARAARQGLDACRELLPDVLPDEVRQAHKLCYVNYAYENIHFPASPEALEVARRRLVFEELFLLTCGLQLLRQRRRDVAGPACRRMSMEPFYRRLPFARGTAPGHCRRRGRHGVRQAHEPPVPGGRGQRKDHGGGGVHLVRRGKRVADGPDGPHGNSGPAALSGAGAAAGPVFHPVRPADRVHPVQGTAGDPGRAGGWDH